jgi:hypothetical protein
MILPLLALLFRIECWFYGIDISTDKAAEAIREEANRPYNQLERESTWRTR